MKMNDDITPNIRERLKEVEVKLREFRMVSTKPQRMSTLPLRFPPHAHIARKTNDFLRWGKANAQFWPIQTL